MPRQVSDLYDSLEVVFIVDLHVEVYSTFKTPFPYNIFLSCAGHVQGRSLRRLFVTSWGRTPTQVRIYGGQTD